MTDRLDLARRAWRATAPTAEEVEAGALRIERALGTRRDRPVAARRWIAVTVATLVLGAALAYAASGRRSPAPPAPPRPIVPASAVLPSPPAAAHPIAPPPAPTDPEPRKLPRATPPAPVPAASAAPPDRGSWQAVDSALAAHDEPRAARALEDLARSEDAATRAKARLGLAQLAASHGDCARARSLAQQIAAAPGIPGHLVDRARTIARECR